MQPGMLQAPMMDSGLVALCVRGAERIVQPPYVDASDCRHSAAALLEGDQRPRVHNSAPKQTSRERLSQSLRICDSDNIGRCLVPAGILCRTAHRLYSPCR